MSSYQYKFLGRDSLPRSMSREDALQHCSLLPEHIAAIKSSHVRRDRYLGLAVQLSFLIATGKHPDPKAPMPPAMLRLLCDELGVHQAAIASLKSIYARERAVREHRTWARDVLGFVPFDEPSRDQVAKALGVRAGDSTSVDELFNAGLEWLYINKVVIPGDRTLRDIAREAFGVVEALALKTVQSAVRPALLQAALKIMFEESATPGMSVLEWLRQAAGKHGVKGLEEGSSRIAYLKSLEAHVWDLKPLSMGRIHAFAQQVVHRPPSETARRSLQTRTVEIICFLKHTLWELTDEAIFRANRRTSDLIRQGAKRVETLQAQRTVAYRTSIQSIRELAADTGKSTKERLAAIVTLADQVLDQPQVSHARVVREALIERSDRVQTILGSLQGLDIEGHAAQKDTQLFAAVKQLQDDGVKVLPPDFDTSCVDAPWRPLVDDADRVRALKALRACALARARKGLLSGRLWVAHSASYRSHADTLIPEAEWRRDKQKICHAYGLETDAKKALALQYELLKVGLSELETCLDKGLVEIDEDGAVRIPRLRALQEDPELKRTNQELSDLIGPVQMPDLMLAIDSKTRISTVLLGREPSQADELKALYAALLAHGTEVDAKAAAAMIPGLSVNQVSAMMRRLETPGRLRGANERLIEFQQQFPIVQLWGDGRKASSDMMSLDATRHLGISRTDPRRRTMAAGVYTHILGSYPIIYDQPIVLMTRQGGPAVEGVERYNSTSADRIKVDLLAVDTHGYTYPTMAVAKLLKFDLCPQLAGLPDRKIWLPRGMKVPEALERVGIANISERAIVAAWDEMLRLTASVLSGRVSASWVLARNGSAARGGLVQRGLDQYGRLLRSVFLCDYFANDGFRREIHTLLNRGESVHQLQRAIYYGRIAAERGRRRDELKAISGAHALLTNMVIGWNTMMLQTVIDRLRASGQRVEDDLVRHIGPVHFGHINFRGTMSFSVERYADLLLKPSTSTKRSAAA